MIDAITQKTATQALLYDDTLSRVVSGMANVGFLDSKGCGLARI